jgi:hypothetical protein
MTAQDIEEPTHVDELHIVSGSDSLSLYVVPQPKSQHYGFLKECVKRQKYLVVGGEFYGTLGPRRMALFIR